jgi:hypothetical protein
MQRFPATAQVRQKRARSSLIHSHIDDHKGNRELDARKGPFTDLTNYVFAVTLQATHAQAIAQTPVTTDPTSAARNPCHDRPRKETSRVTRNHNNCSWVGTVFRAALSRACTTLFGSAQGP